MHRNLPATLNTTIASSHEDVNIPFQLYVPPGESSFTVGVPRHYDIAYQSNSFAPKHRMFQFSQLCITPGYYSQKAARLDLNSKAEESQKVPLSIRASYMAYPGMYRTEGTMIGDELRWEHSRWYVE